MQTPAADGNTANFSPAVRAGGLVFVSGQASVDENGSIVPGTFAEEMDRSMRNVRRVLSDYGLDLGDVVRVGAYVQDPADLGEFNDLYRRYFTPPLPARTTITNCLTEKIKFEIDVVAAVR
jgi:2-iminobutanoate/2-iminopropanoate deaminase